MGTSHPTVESLPECEGASTDSGPYATRGLTLPTNDDLGRKVHIWSSICDYSRIHWFRRQKKQQHCYRECSILKSYRQLAENRRELTSQNHQDWLQIMAVTA